MERGFHGYVYAQIGSKNHSESHSVCVMVGIEEQLPSAVMPSVSEAADSSAVSLLLELSSPATVQIRPY